MMISSPASLVSRTLRITALLGSLALVASATQAQAAREYDPDAPEVSREADALSDELRPDGDRPVAADTILTFTNASRRPNLIGCTARNGNGAIVGSARTPLPPHGVRYVRVSDLTEQRPFAGSVLCKAVEPARAVALFLGPGLTNLPVVQGRHHDLIQFRVPLAVTY